MLLAWATAVIAIESLTEILVSSRIFEGPRNFIGSKNAFLKELIECGYCTSVWVAAPTAFIVPGIISGDPLIDIFLRWLVLHRLSNLFHGVAVRIIHRPPLEIVQTLMNQNGGPT